MRRVLSVFLILGWSLGSLLLGLAGTPGPGRGSPARFSSGQFLIADLDADPRLFFNQPGAIFSLRRDITMALGTVYSPRQLVHPLRAMSGPKKILYIVDSDADPMAYGNRNGAIFSVDTRLPITNPPEVAVASPRFREPVDLFIDDQGRFIVLDAAANPVSVGETEGAVFRIDPETNVEEILATSDYFGLPKRMIEDLDGTLLILDARADPLGFGLEAGAVFRLDPQFRTLSVLFSIPGFDRLESIRLDPDGNYILVDRDADPYGYGGRPGALFRVDRNTLEFDGVVVANPNFVDPVDALYDPDGRLYVVDRFADVVPNPATRGAIYRVNTESGEIEETWVSEHLRSPVSIEYVTGADLDSSSVVFVDLNGTPVLPGDLLEIQLQIKNTGDEPAEAVTLVDSLRGGLSAVGGSFSTTGGELDFLPNVPAVRWRGDIQPGAVEQIRFQAAVEEAGSPYVQQIVGAASEFVDLFINWIFPVESAFRGGVVVVSDPGGIFALREGSSVMIPLSRNPALFRPMGMIFTAEGRLIIGDARAEIVQNEPGAVFQLEPGGALGVLTAGLPLQGPGGVALDPDGNIFVSAIGVDRPDPFPDEPGLLYRLDPISFQPETLFVGDPIVHPINLFVDEGNRLFVVDFDADPLETGAKPGAIFQFDYVSGEIVRSFTSADFVDPVGITKLTDGRLVVADQAADPLELGENTGALFQIDLETGAVDLLHADDDFVSPFAVVQDTLGDILIADAEGDPSNVGFFTGAIWRYDILDDELSIAVQSVNFEGPRGLTIRKLGDFRTSSIEGGDTNGPPFLVGDTLSVAATLVNSGESTVPAVTAEFVGTSSLDVLSYESDEGSMGILPGTNRVKWLGTIARGDSVKVRALYTVKLDAPGDEVSFWEPVEVSLDIGGPFAPRVDPVAARLVTPMRPGDHIVVDADADPLQTGQDTGALFLVDPESGGARLLFASIKLVDPFSALLDSLGNIIILDAGANPGEFPTARGAIFRVDVWTGDIEPIFWSDSLLGAVEIVPEPDGTYLLVDQSTRLTEEQGQRGAIFRLRTLEGPMELVSADPAFRLPTDALRLPDGDLLVSDIFANPLGLPGNTGAIFRVDGETGTVTDTIQTADLSDPVDLDWLPDGRILICDESANPLGLPPPTGALFAMDPATGEISRVAVSAFFVQPYRARVTADERVFVLDRSTRPPGSEEFQGAVLQVDVDRASVSYYAGTDAFVLPRNHRIVPFPAVQIRSFASEDEDSFPLDPGDLLSYTVELVNPGRLDEPQAVFVDTLPPELALLPETATASAGVIDLDGDVLTWSGSVPAGENVVISYTALLNPVTSQGARIQRRVYVSGKKARPVQAAMEHVVATTVDPGTMFVIDSDADPLGIRTLPGGLFKVTFPLGNATLVASSSDLVTPVDVELLSETDRTFLILDADSDPAEPGSRKGGLFIADARDGSISFVASDTTWIEPVQLLKVSEEEVLVLDLVANPFRFGTVGLGPGALYRVTLPEGDVEIVYSDTTLVRPSGMALDGKGGLYIADKEADPFGIGWRRGALYRLDLSTKEIEPVVVDPILEDPSRVAVLPSGDILLLDTGAQQPGYSRGSVFIIEDGEIRFHSGSPIFRSATDLFLDGNNSVFVVDRDADPLQYGSPVGAVFRYNATRNSYRSLASGPQFKNPSSAMVYLSMTPVVLKSFEAVPAEDGAVHLAWEVTADIQPTGYLVLRRRLDDDDSYRVLNPGHPVRGAGLLSYRDETAEPGRSYSYMLAAISSDGGFVYLGPVEITVPDAELRFVLQRPRPNPMRSVTLFRYSVPVRQEVELVIYDLQGRVVRRLARGVHDPGVYTKPWDGRNQSSHPVAAGVYFARFSGNGREMTRRVVVLR